VPAIEPPGLLCGKSMGKRPVVILLADVPRAWLRKSRKGLWYSVRDIPADRIRRALSFAELAGASAA
jgi:hypothetical protein